MKIFKIVSLITFLVLFSPQLLLAQNHAPVVTNVDFNQRTDGSKIVDITYDVNDADGNTLEVIVEASSDGGATWGLSCTNVTGAIGSGIISGTKKTIAWNAGVEHPNFYNPSVQIRITAKDGVNPCEGIATIIYEEKTYNTVEIGRQCWLRENLDVGVYVASTSTGSSHSDVTNNGIIEKYCYENNESNCATYGGLYDWNEAMQYVTTPGTKGICPTGWHIPTKAEFESLITTVNNDGNALKAVGQGWGSGAGTNTSGFSGLLAGSRSTNGAFNLREYPHFWSSTENSASAYYLYLLPTDSGIGLYNNADKKYGSSIRCLKD